MSVALCGRGLFSRTFTSSAKRVLPIQVSPEVSHALSEGKPVVALESTIVAHGMPWPQNYEAACAVESLIREQGAIPATIAVLNGKPVVGLSSDELEHLAKAGSKVMKCSTRELPLVMSSGKDGATTVAATARLATMCGIDVFVTGGCGGVHRNGEVSWDVSADLVELRSNPIVVVCAGVKSILDIGRTLEYLETMGIPVLSYGTDEFPAFFSPYSNFKSPARLDTPLQVAAHFMAARSLNLSAGTLLAVPNPHPAAGEEVEQAIHDALAAATVDGIVGAATTPYVLKYVAEKTGGKSLESNISLVMNNALVGAQIACELAALKTSATK